MNTKLELGFMRHNKDKEESQRIVDFAIAHNQAYFETCYFYFDKCEDYIYSLLQKYNRNQYEICGKMPVKNIMESKGCKNIFLEQLKRVPGHYFDTYILQALDTQTAYVLLQDDAIGYLLKEKEKGTIGKFGLSIQCTPETFKGYLDMYCWDIVQMPFNYYDWFLCRGNELYDLATQYNLPIIAQAPMKGGLLTKLTNPVNKTPSQFALDFVVSHHPDYILSGCSQLNSYTDTYNAIYNYKDEKIDYTLYENIIKTYFKATTIDCIYCNQCHDVCPVLIPFSGIFYLYNQLVKNYSIEGFNNFNAINKSLSSPLHLCPPGCNKCDKACPKQLNVRQEMITKTFELRT